MSHEIIENVADAGQSGRRRPGHPCPDHWHYLETVDRTLGKHGVYILWVCSDECRASLWSQWAKGPGPANLDEKGTDRMRKRMESTP